MYEKQFQFRSRPFCSIPSAEHYFPASSIDTALETIKMCIDRASGPATLFGQSGWGKSQLMAVLQRDYQHQFRIVNVMACTRMSRRHDLLQNILFELGQPYREMSEGELRLALIDYLKPTAQCPNGVLLLVDDAYTLPYRLLDELRMITNFVRDGQPRVRLVIAGTQSLEEKLTHPQLESLNQRIAARCYLQCLRRDEVEPYIRHQIVRAGCPDQDIFQNSAIAAVAQLCEGNPRTINQICDYALILAASCGQTTVSGEIIAEAFSDIQRLPASMWIPALESKPPLPENGTSGVWDVVEYGQIGDATFAKQPPSAPPTPEMTAAIPETAITEAIAQSADTFSKMVDSLAHLYSDSLEDDSLPTEPEVRASDTTPDDSQTAAYNPFAEPFAEEVSILDNYAQLAARQNRSATQMTENDVSRLEQHLQQIKIEISNALPLAPAIEGFDRNDSIVARPQTFQATLNDVDAAATPAIECPIVDHQAYQFPCDNFIDEFCVKHPDIATQDDRDMLVVSQSTSSLEAVRTSPPDLGGVSVSRGQAVRMDYGRLFQQLRGGDNPQQPSTRK